MKGGKVADDMCPMLGFNISNVVPVGIMKAFIFCSCPNHN